MAREPLPDRRMALTRTLGRFDGPDVEVTVGYYDDGSPGEIFLSGGKEGSLLRFVLADAAVLVSIALQHGIPLDVMIRTLLREPVGDEKDGITRPASPLGVVLETLNQEKIAMTMETTEEKPPVPQQWTDAIAAAAALVQSTLADGPSTDKLLAEMRGLTPPVVGPSPGEHDDA
jgi:hypothetical protein